MVPAPLLLPPARPQRRQPARARRDRADHGLLAGPRAVGLPHRRGPVPHRAGRAARRRDRRPARAPARPARLRQPPQRRRDPARRGQPARGRGAQRSSATRTATSCTCCFDFLGNQALYLSLARGDAEPLRRTLRGAPEIPDTTVDGALRAQPRRAHARQARRATSARRSSTASAPTRGCSSTGAGCAAACRRCSTATRPRSGWSTRWPSRCPAPAVLFYGEEIGMGENLAIDGRMAVRSPMQWAPEPQRRVLARPRTRARSCAR